MTDTRASQIFCSLAVCLLIVSGCHKKSDSALVEALTTQVRGLACTHHAWNVTAFMQSQNQSRYTEEETSERRVCGEIPQPPWWNPYARAEFESDPRWDPRRCVWFAARCLGAIGADARSSVPALITALYSGPADVQTVDGPIRTRTAIIEALGRIGAEEAAGPIRELLVTRDLQTGGDESADAGFPPFDKKVAQLALSRLEAGAVDLMSGGINDDKD